MKGLKRQQVKISASENPLAEPNFSPKKTGSFRNPERKFREVEIRGNIGERQTFKADVP